MTVYNAVIFLYFSSRVKSEIHVGADNYLLNYRDRGYRWPGPRPTEKETYISRRQYTEEKSNYTHPKPTPYQEPDQTSCYEEKRHSGCSTDDHLYEQLDSLPRLHTTSKTYSDSPGLVTSQSDIAASKDKHHTGDGATTLTKEYIAQNYCIKLQQQQDPPCESYPILQPLQTTPTHSRSSPCSSSSDVSKYCIVEPSSGHVPDILHHISDDKKQSPSTPRKIQHGNWIMKAPVDSKSIKHKENIRDREKPARRPKRKTKKKSNRYDVTQPDAIMLETYRISSDQSQSPPTRRKINHPRHITHAETDA